MRRKLRIAASWFFLAVSIALSISWFSSYGTYWVASNVFCERRFIIYGSLGQITLEVQKDFERITPEPQLSSRIITDELRSRIIRLRERDPGALGIHWYFYKLFFWVRAHFAYLVLPAALVTILLRPKPRWRFGIRDAFALTTVIAALSAAFVALSRLAEQAY